MARMNVVTLLGVVTGNPAVILDDDGKPIKSSLYISVVSPDRENGTTESDIVFFKPFIYSEDLAMNAEIVTWKANDIVFIKGVITTLNAKRGVICAHCGKKSARDGEVTLITPIYVEKRVTDFTEKEAMKYLIEHREISNQVYLMGYLCADVVHKKKASVYPDIISQSSYKGLSAYQIAVNRKFFIQQDVPTNRTDYPHIISVGERAKMDAKCIKEGSLVLVDGMLVTREFRRTNTCPHCNQTFDWPEKVMEVLTFGTEYLQNYITPEEYEQKRAQEIAELEASISEE